jgi:hypothetical protein
LAHAAHGTPKREVAHEDSARGREASAMWLADMANEILARLGNISLTSIRMFGIPTASDLRE